MSQDLWTAVDQYYQELLHPADATLDQVLATSKAEQLPAINVSPNQGKLLHLLAKIRGATRILEIGTLAGYSTIWLARALPPTGKLVTLEADPKHARIAKANIEHAGLGSMVELKVGKAVDLLPGLTGPFDMVFIDADKQNIPKYFEWSLKLCRKGSLIIVDNVVREGAVVNSKSSDLSVQGVRKFNEMLAAEKRVSATAIQTVSNKGYDGFAAVLVVAD